METKNMFLKLFSDSFSEKLQNLKTEYNDVISAHLLEAEDILKKYNLYCEPLPSDDEFVSKFKNEFTKSFSEKLSEKITDYCRQITLKKDTFELTFLPKYCDPVYTPSGNWDKKNRQSGKPGKIIQKFIGEGKFKNADYEQFIYRLKALWSTGGYSIKLVSGEDIRYWYNEENYYSMASTLGRSCMAHPECQRYFDLYCEQPECQMLIALKGEGLAARALVWTVDGVTFMDRVYYIEDSLYNIFVNYAKEQKWLIRENNSLLGDGDSQFFKTPEDNYQSSREITFKIKLKRDYSYYPYIDSFRYLDVDNMCLATTPLFSHMGYCSGTDGDYDLRDNDCFCPNCDAEIYDEDDVVYSEWYDLNGCTNCMEYSECMDDYIPQSEIIDVNISERETDIACESYLKEYPSDYVQIGTLWYSTDHPLVKAQQEQLNNEQTIEESVNEQSIF